MADRGKSGRICTVCARAGSKGAKNKNLRFLHGKPLVAHTVEQAKACGLADVVVLASDSDQILEVGRKHGADFVVKRPPEMATDEASKLPAMRHAVLEAEKLTGRFYRTVLDLDPTSPLRDIQDIAGAVALFEGKNVSNLITGSLSRRSPYFNLVEVDKEGIARLSKPLSKPVIRRQESPLCYDMNASIYIWNREVLFKDPRVFYEDTAFYAMPVERSMDIDYELDFEIVEFLMARKLSQPPQ